MVVFELTQKFSHIKRLRKRIYLRYVAAVKRNRKKLDSNTIYIYMYIARTRREVINIITIN